MRTHDQRAGAAHVLVAAVVLVAQGCAATQAPPGAIVGAKETLRTARGGWSGVLLQGEGPRSRVYGELLAVSADTVFVLAQSGFRAIPRDSVESVTLWVYRPESAAGITGLGVLLSLTNGLLFLVTAPLWIISGALASGLRQSEARMKRDRSELDSLVAHARWPQGLPGALNRSRLRLPDAPW